MKTAKKNEKKKKLQSKLRKKDYKSGFGVGLSFLFVFDSLGIQNYFGLTTLIQNKNKKTILV